MRIKFDKDPLAVEKNKYVTKIAYIVYDLYAWPNNPLNNFILKNCMLVATNIVKNSDKEKWIYSTFGIAFDGTGSQNLCNDFAKSAVIFGVDNSFSSHTDNCKNNFLVFGEGPTYCVNGSFEKRFSINFSKANTKICLSFHYNGDNSYLFVNKRNL